MSILRFKKIHSIYFGSVLLVSFTVISTAFAPIYVISHCYPAVFIDYIQTYMNKDEDEFIGTKTAAFMDSPRVNSDVV